MKDYIFIASKENGEVIESVPFTWDTLDGSTEDEKELTLKSWMQEHVSQMPLFEHASMVKVNDKQIILKFLMEPYFISCNIVEISRDFNYIKNDHRMILDEVSSGGCVFPVNVLFDEAV